MMLLFSCKFGFRKLVINRILPVLGIVKSTSSGGRAHINLKRYQRFCHLGFLGFLFSIF